MLCAVEFERNRLVDRHGYGLGGGVAVVPYMDGDGFSFHESVEPCGGVTAQASLTPVAGTDALFRELAAVIALAIRLAAKPAPNAKRIPGPNVFAATNPTK